MEKKKKQIIAISLSIVLVVIVLIVVISVRIKPSFKTSENDSALSSQLKQEEDSIKNVFQTRFEFLNDRFTVEKVVLIHQGDYAALVVEEGSLYYKAIMVKGEDGWSVIGVPAVVLYYDDYPGVSRELVRAVNDLGVYDNE